MPLITISDDRNNNKFQACDYNLPTLPITSNLHYRTFKVLFTYKYTYSISTG